MIQYLEHSRIDRTKWDALIYDCNGIYAQSWYLDVVSPCWSALVLDDYEAVMPITGGVKFGVNYLFQPFFAQQLGVFSRQMLSEETLRKFLKAIPKKFRFAEIRLNESNVFGKMIQGIEYHRNVVLNTSFDYNTIRANYHTNTKRNLAKAEHNGLELFYETELPEIIAMFRANRGASVKVWGDAEYDLLLRLNEAAMRHHQAFTVSVKLQETKELLCGGLYFMTDKHVIFLFSGCTEKGRQLNAMTLMMDDVIKDFAGHNCLFDFEGSDDDNLARFYLGFGGIETRYPSYTFNNMSEVGKGILRVWKRLKKP